MHKLANTAVVLSFLLASWGVLAGPLNINAADAASIAQTIDGVGEAKAEAIVAYRRKHGDFKRVGDLARVKGIGTKTVERNRAKLTVGRSAK